MEEMITIEDVMYQRKYEDCDVYYGFDNYGEVVIIKNGEIQSGVTSVVKEYITNLINVEDCRKSYTPKQRVQLNILVSEFMNPFRVARAVKQLCRYRETVDSEMESFLTGMLHKNHEDLPKLIRNVKRSHEPYFELV